MSNHTLLQQIAHWCTSLKFENIPPQVIDTARNALIDYVAVTVAGSQTEVARNIQKFAHDRSPDGPCHLLGVDQSCSMAYAAYANGVASHALDFDDVSWATIGHPTVSVAPTLFAASEQQPCDGKTILLAYIAAVEAQHQIARWVMPDLSEKGWHTTPVIGVFGGAVASAILMGLNEEQLANSLAIAASMASGIRGNFGSQTKALHAGLSAYNGVNAVELSLAGITGKLDVIENNDGFIDCFANQGEREYEVSLGDQWDLIQNGLVFKQYPCCSGSHCAIDSILELIEEFQLNASMVASIDVGVSLLGPRELVCNKPTNATEAKFSMQYAVSSALVYGKVGLEQFTDQAVQNKTIQRLIRKVNMFIDPELSKLGFIGTAPVKLTVTLNNGATLSKCNYLAKGNPEKPLSKMEIERKYINCTESILGLSRSRLILEQLNNLEIVSELKLK